MTRLEAFPTRSLHPLCLCWVHTLLYGSYCNVQVLEEVCFTRMHSSEIGRYTLESPPRNMDATVYGYASSVGYNGNESNAENEHAHVQHTSTTTVEPTIPQEVEKLVPEINHVGGGGGNSTTRSSIQRNRNEPKVETLDPLKMCFVSAEFSERLEDADTLPVVQADMRTVPPRHFCFTNMEQLQTHGWDKIVLLDADELHKYKRQITKSRWPNFMGWQHARLEHCQIIFYGDAYLMNPVNETIGRNMVKKIKTPDVGRMQGRQPGIGPRDGPIKELTKNAVVGKDSFETANDTIAWLLNQTGYQYKRTRTLVYKNAQFGYDPYNPRFRNFVTDFWKEYSKEMGSWRDQAYWAYFLSKHGMKPINFPVKGITSHGEGGKQGHNRHVYDLRNKAV